MSNVSSTCVIPVVSPLDAYKNQKSPTDYTDRLFPDPHFRLCDPLQQSDHAKR